MNKTDDLLEASKEVRDVLASHLRILSRQDPYVLGGLELKHCKLDLECMIAVLNEAIKSEEQTS